MEICDSTDEKLDYFNQTVLQILNDHAPLYRVWIKKKQSLWVTREIHDQMDIRDKSQDILELPDLLMIGSPIWDFVTEKQPYLSL